ncbi:helix-turn-helix domain-containing protein [Variovorax sp. LjRoot130]|uniref:helix-turn-helix domain-containing protein n=1 Tax=Variovorax sp. LjRoot130 TaxID=3342261 RepID=UPI003ECCF26F
MHVVEDRPAPGGLVAPARRQGLPAPGHIDAAQPEPPQKRALSGLAERSFQRRFKLATGMTPMEYVQTLRIEEAKHLLETTEAPVEAIAGEVGYDDAAFFSRMFRRAVSLSPAQYRRRFGGLRAALAGTRH